MSSQHVPIGFRKGLPPLDLRHPPQSIQEPHRFSTLKSPKLTGLKCEPCTSYIPFIMYTLIVMN